MKYTVIVKAGDIIAEGNNRKELIKVCNQQRIPSSVITADEIVYENRAQKKNSMKSLINEANEAKERLARISEKLEEAGFHRKARSAMGLVYDIEYWQNWGW